MKCILLGPEGPVGHTVFGVGVCVFGLTSAGLVAGGGGIDRTLRTTQWTRASNNREEVFLACEWLLILYLIFIGRISLLV